MTKLLWKDASNEGQIQWLGKNGNSGWKCHQGKWKGWVLIGKWKK